MTAAKTSYFWIALALALYLFFSLTYLELPGLQYDETNFVNAALGNEQRSLRRMERGDIRKESCRS